MNNKKSTGIDSEEVPSFKVTIDESDDAPQVGRLEINDYSSDADVMDVQLSSAEHSTTLQLKGKIQYL